MQSASLFLLALGGILLPAWAGGINAWAQDYFTPVTLLLLFGAIIGKEMLDIIPAIFS